MAESVTIDSREEPTTTNNIKIGESNVKLSLGEQTISKVYMGDTLLYST